MSFDNLYPEIIKQSDIPRSPEQFVAMVDQLVSLNQDLRDELNRLGVCYVALGREKLTEPRTAIITTDLVGSTQVYANIFSQTNDKMKAAQIVNQIGVLPIQVFFSCLSKYLRLDKKTIDKLRSGLYFEGDGYKFEVKNVTEEIATLIISILKKINANFNLYLEDEFTDSYGTVNYEGTDISTFIRFRGFVREQSKQDIPNYVDPEAIEIEKKMKRDTNDLTIVDAAFPIPVLRLSPELDSMLTQVEDESYNYVSRVDCAVFIQPLMNLLDEDQEDFLPKLKLYCTRILSLFPQNLKDLIQNPRLPISAEQKSLLISYAINAALQSFFATLDGQFKRDIEKITDNPDLVAQAHKIKTHFDGKRIVIYSGMPITINALNPITQKPMGLFPRSNAILWTVFSQETVVKFGLNFERGDFEQIDTGGKSLEFFYADKNGNKESFIKSPNPTGIYLHEQKKRAPK